MTRPAPTSSSSTTRTWPSSSASRPASSRDGLIAITEGLKAGERVIVQGQQRVRPGMTVNPSVAPPSASTQKQ